MELTWLTCTSTIVYPTYTITTDLEVKYTKYQLGTANNTVIKIEK